MTSLYRQLILVPCPGADRVMHLVLTSKIIAYLNAEKYANQRWISKHSKNVNRPYIYH